MNEIKNKFWLAGHKFIPKMNLKQSGFTYSAHGPFTKNKERIKKSNSEKVGGVNHPSRWFFQKFIL